MLSRCRMGKSGVEDLSAAILYYTKQEDDPRRGRQQTDKDTNTKTAMPISDKLKRTTGLDIYTKVQWDSIQDLAEKFYIKRNVLNDT